MSLHRTDHQLKLFLRTQSIDYNTCLAQSRQVKETMRLINFQSNDIANNNYTLQILYCIVE